jgi:transcriptional regulator with XRE-family HTH domain
MDMKSWGYALEALRGSRPKARVAIAMGKSPRQYDTWIKNEKNGPTLDTLEKFLQACDATWYDWAREMRTAHQRRQHSARPLKGVGRRGLIRA